MRLVFAGTSSFAVPVLSALADSTHEIVLVLTRPDRPAGRGRRLRPSPVRVAAEAGGLAVETPEATAFTPLAEPIAALAPDVLVVAAYGHLVPPRLLALARHGGINVHPSLLPRWRGAAPVERAVLAGDAETGVSIMHMEAGLDTGPLYRVERTAIGAQETAGELSARLAELGSVLLLEVLAALAEGRARAEPQRGEAIYAARLSSAEARLHFTESATALARRVRAFNPRPGAWCTCEGERLRLLRAEAFPGKAEVPSGTIVTAGAAGVDIATGEGLLRVSELQRAGRRVQGAAEFARGGGWIGRRFD